MSDRISEAKRRKPLPDLMAQLGLTEHAKKSARCPFHEDGSNSFSIYQDQAGAWAWKCHAGCGGGDEIAFLEAVQHLAPGAGVRPFLDLAGVGTNGSDYANWHTSQLPPRGKIVREYSYLDAAGKELFQAVRLEPKSFRQRRRNPDGSWAWNLNGIEPVLYRLPEVQESEEVWLVEGEKDADTIAGFGLTATCNPMGAGKWRESYTKALAGKTVILCGDNDEPGEKHMDAVAKAIAGTSTAKRVRVPSGFKDVSDYIASLADPGAGMHELGRAVQAAEVLTPDVHNCEPQLSAMEDNKSALPPMDDAFDMLAEDIPEPPEVVEGLLHQGSKGVLGGGSKSFKTWLLTDLAVAVASGQTWLGFPTRQGRVLYLNLEIQRGFFAQRLRHIKEARRITLAQNQLCVWTLRGHAADLSTLLPEIIRRAKQEGFSLIIVDPIYKCLGRRDENAAGDIGSLLNEIERLAVQTGAAVVFGAHFSKGNQAGKESMDRIGGSGVFARDPDSILVLTKHEEDDAFTVDATLRNHPPVDPFVVRWQFPLMQRDGKLDPQKLKQVGGRAKEHDAKELLDILGAAESSMSQWQQKANEETGMSERTFYRLTKELKTSRKIRKSTLSGLWTKA